MNSSTPRILLALGQRDCSRACLMRAFDVARALEATVDVVRVLPQRHGWRRLVPPMLCRWLERRQQERARATLRATRYWLAGAYGAEPAAGNVVVRSGDFVREVVSHSKRRDTLLIIVPPDLARLGSVVTRLALLAGQRVFVARPVCRSRTILAASDLATPGFPVLREAARLVSLLRMALVSFHNLKPLSKQGDDDGAQRSWSQAASPKLRLELALESLCTPGAAAVRSGVDPASAIVSEARERQVDLVVVGVKQRSRLRRLIYGNIAAQVVKRAVCSVVVAPVSS